jgi:hypothetical protein
MDPIALEPAATAPVIDCAAYADGLRVCDVGVDDVHSFLGKDGQFVWLGLYEPDQALLRKVQQQFGLHDLAIEDAYNAHQRPKLEEYEGSLFVVLRTGRRTCSSAPTTSSPCGTGRCARTRASDSAASRHRGCWPRGRPTCCTP